MKKYKFLNLLYHSLKISVVDDFITQLEKFNIGKPATYATIFENIENNIHDRFIEKKICERKA